MVERFESFLEFAELRLSKATLFPSPATDLVYRPRWIEIVRKRFRDRNRSVGESQRGKRVAFVDSDRMIRQLANHTTRTIAFFREQVLPGSFRGRADGRLP